MYSIVKAPLKTISVLEWEQLDKRNHGGTSNIIIAAKYMYIHNHVTVNYKHTIGQVLNATFF